MSTWRRWAQLALVICFASIATAANAAEHSTAELGERLPYVTMAPFAALLLAIAILPLAAGHWWEKNRNKGIVAALLALPIALYLFVAWPEQGPHVLFEKVEEYLAFIALLGSLFVISGGVYVQGSLSGTPLVNTAILGFGCVIANLVGTTGASVLLIRPLLRANASRVQKAHVVVFFIFAVSNCGGLLTPLGDPPLFLGFLSGVPFEWTLRLWPQWLLVNLSILVIFHIVDQIALGREEARRPGSQYEELLKHEPLRVKGAHNFIFLAGIMAVVYAAGRGIGNDGDPWPFGIQEGLMLLLAAASYFLTPGDIRERNRFSFAPIIEVAVLFAGIFVTMAPALLILNAAGPKLGISEPWQFFWVTGVLSSFLDNAPTYLTFAATACGIHGVPLEGRYLETFLNLPPAAGTHKILAAVSCGAVFMGANTYIGNGPNFMVKAIAEENGVPMPGFFTYMAYSCIFLLPIFAVVTWVFFR